MTPCGVDYGWPVACMDCGADTLPLGCSGRAEFYMVTAEVWAAAGAAPFPADDILCIGCLEARLGR